MCYFSESFHLCCVAGVTGLISCVRGCWVMETDWSQISFSDISNTLMSLTRPLPVYQPLLVCVRMCVRVL